MRESKAKVREGVVVSARTPKTVVVEVERVFRHPFYKKIVKTTKNFKAHDELGNCRKGDLVEIMETRPISKDKHWRIVRRITSDTKP